MNSKMTIKKIKSILLDITHQLENDAPTNQNIIYESYIPLKSYDCGDVTHFAMIENSGVIPNSVVELGFDHDNYELYAYDKDQNLVFDVVLDDMVNRKQISNKLLTNFIRAFEKYYGTYVN